MSDSTPCTYCHLPISGTLEAPGKNDEPVYCCYGCRFAHSITQARGEAGHATWMLTRLGVAAFLSMAVMVFSLYLYSQEVYATQADRASELSDSLAGLMRYLSMLFATPVFFILGWPILTGAIEQWRQRILSTDALIVLGVAAAYIYSYVSTLTEGHATYFETGCMVLVLVTFGRWLEASGKLRATHAVEALDRLLPDEAEISREGEWATVSTSEIHEGDTVRVKAGRRIPVDGDIAEGASHVDEQLVTGESVPVLRQVGQSVRAGSLNLDGLLVLRATRVGEASTLGRLRALLEAARHSRSHYERLADRVARIFIPIVVVLACVGAGMGFNRGGIDAAIMAALAVLLIACPCALGIATPTAIWVALGRAATAGILCRRGDVLEVLARVRTLAFDKTGTLTTGTPQLEQLIETNKSEQRTGNGHASPLSIAGGLAIGVDHVLSRSLLDYAACQKIEPQRFDRIEVKAGAGVIGSCGDSVAMLGSVALLREQGVVLTDAEALDLERLTSTGQPLATVACDRRLLGIFGFRETLRDETGEVIDRLKRDGYELVVLTGDHERRGKLLSEQLGVQVRAELTPEGKVNALRTLGSDRGPVAMIGDGLNDAPALAAAAVGVAMGCGADVTRESADVCLLGSDLRSVPELLVLAKRTVRTIRGNLFWAFAYNVIGIALAMLGWLTPVFAALAMVLSSLLVVSNSLRLTGVAFTTQAGNES